MNKELEMKTFANKCVLAVIMGVAMTGATAQADFNNARSQPEPSRWSNW
jgi:hypothetical protein